MSTQDIACSQDFACSLLDAVELSLIGFICLAMPCFLFLLFVAFMVLLTYSSQTVMIAEIIQLDKNESVCAD